MTNLPETDSFDAGVYQFETTDAALGGVNGVMNTPGTNLANRTRWLFNRVTALLGFTNQYAAATGTTAAIVANYTPAVTALADGMEFAFRVSAANAAGPKFTPCDGSVSGTTAIAPLPVYGADMNALGAGAIVGQARVRYSSAVNNGAGGYVLVENPGGYQIGVTPPASDNTTKGATTAWVTSNIQPLVTACIANVATAAGLVLNLGTPGYVRLPSWLGGWVLQWGTGQTTTAGQLVLFPLTFPNTFLGMAISDGGTSPLAWGYKNQSVSGFNAYATASSDAYGGQAYGAYSYIAIGK